ncbi:hypothetical protein Mmc1_1490 [Magnetococcus marinus MC-1]|uniref:Uncharacterized protein n=1 Tax=Magnetococcus marinus (strain ATCC BAA-1437 / JCM 17883 / MC-1) TaxID=156889 RepID=A0L7Q6_MAGMM|nr:hypothetical protein Mmc1_1490 [Magnetococcus marinus MC-1]
MDIGRREKRVGGTHGEKGLLSMFRLSGTVLVYACKSHTPCLSSSPDRRLAKISRDKRFQKPRGAYPGGCRILKTDLERSLRTFDITPTRRAPWLQRILTHSPLWCKLTIMLLTVFLGFSPSPRPAQANPCCLTSHLHAKHPHPKQAILGSTETMPLPPCSTSTYRAPPTRQCLRDPPHTPTLNAHDPLRL